MSNPSTDLTPRRALIDGLPPGLKAARTLAARGGRGAAYLGLAVAAALACGTPAKADVVTVRVMTQNVDEGTDFSDFLQATSPAAFVAAVTTTYHDILATDPTGRAAAVANEIATESPDVVSLQEAAILRTGPRGAATAVQFDYLQSLMTDLGKLGQSYTVVASVPELDAEAPSTLGFDVRITGADVILVRSSDKATVADIQSDPFSNVQVNQSAVGPIPNSRGSASVDISLGGATFRFATTHLETSQPIQLAQMNELIANVGGTTLPLIMAADFNANADDPLDPTFATYKAATNAGFVDAWTKLHGNDPGFTCCQASDLLNATSSLNQRIDLVLLRGAIGVDDIELIGDSDSDRTLSGLWPSDHAGVVATLEIPELSAAVPEATTWAMMLFGFAGLGLGKYCGRRRRKTGLLSA